MEEAFEELMADNYPAQMDWRQYGVVTSVKY